MTKVDGIYDRRMGIGTAEAASLIGRQGFFAWVLGVCERRYLGVFILAFRRVGLDT
jgi:hypothetical protein